MIKFSIYKKSGKFYWTTEKIIYITMFSSLVIGFIADKAFKSENSYFNKIFIGITVLAFFSGIINKFIGFTKIEKLGGILDGYIVFKSNSIEIENNSFELNEIKRIEIYNDDYRGKLIHTSSGNFGPALSNGTRNYLILFLISGEQKKVNFELINSYDFQKIRTELINYHVKSKIDFWSLANILGEKSSKETSELTEEIKKHYC